MPQPAAPHPIAQSQPLHFQDFSIQTISNQELTPPPPAKPIRMRALPPKYGWGWVARTRAKKRTPLPPRKYFLFVRPS